MVTGTKYRSQADGQTKLKGQRERLNATENPVSAGGGATKTASTRQVYADL